ncbi:MAG: hypothetical protein LYZ70_07075 [Nitrososphaerales archaeon]|nr:hypothetical protein [Nitrososphaerales archaeon]
MSGETNDDGEPSIAVDPANISHIVAHAFTYDPLKSKYAPFYYSLDGGDNWTLNAALPGGEATGDLTLKFGESSGVLYVGMLRSDSGDLNVLRFEDFTTQNYDLLIDRTDDDQPWVEATTALNTDRVYVGSNDTSQKPITGKTATVDFSLDAAQLANFQTARLEVRETPGQDAPSVRPAIHPSGVIYAAYLGWRKSEKAITDVVVCRDDNWGIGAKPFTDLVELNGDGKAGVRVAIGVPLPVSVNLFFVFLGTQRIGSTLSVAVDPTDLQGQTVYLAWADGATPDEYTLHLRKSTNGGVSWSPDLRSIPRAVNPSLAVSSKGVVGFLYQQLYSPGYGTRWQTILERSDDGFKTPPSNLKLADVLDLEHNLSVPSIGDYANLVAVGENDFYGVFSAYNDPDSGILGGYFPYGVKYLRNNDPMNHVLLDGNLTPKKVEPSIDPFFFKVEEKPEYTPGGGAGRHGPWPRGVRFGGSTHAGQEPFQKTVKPSGGDDENK